MKKLATLFSDSAREFRYVSTLTTVAMFAALAAVLGYYSQQLTPFLKIGLTTIPGQIVSYLFGPVVGGCFGGAVDLINYMLKPTGPFFPGFTLTAVLQNVLFGIFLYRKPMSLKRVFMANLAVIIICYSLLDTLWLDIMYGKGFIAILPPRIVKNLLMWPVKSFLVFGLAQVFGKAGFVRMLRARNSSIKQ